MESRPGKHVEDQTEEIPKYSTRLDLLAFNVSSGIACFNWYDLYDDKTSACPIFYLDLKNDNFRYVCSTILGKGKASISPNGKYMIIEQLISENLDSIQMIKLGDDPRSLGLVLADSNKKAINDGFDVEDKFIGWEGDDHIKIKHRLVGRSIEPIASSVNKNHEESAMIVPVGPSIPKNP